MPDGETLVVGDERNRSRAARLATALGLVLLTGLSILRVVRPPAPVPATAPDTVFSAERAMAHVARVAQRPHPMGTAEHDRVRDYILAQLAGLGVKSEVQTTTAVGTRYQEAGRVQNILGYLPGRASNGKAVLLMVHYDGVEAGPAAADDGAGVGALLETLRALRMREVPLRNDIIALFTDGEEAGLLGAAAFVREHPRAKDVAIALNFEARGTSGRSYMFETGPGNLDAVRMLRSARDVTAGSVFTTIYRTLPNDTDLSELAVLGVPAMNFAFADGVERYHTSHDDVAHLNPGSVQHHGLQMLALAEAFASDSLPRPTTGDAVFFDFPLLGLIVYPMWLAKTLAVVLLVLTIIIVHEERDKRGMAVGIATTIVATAACGVAASYVALTGPALWSGAYALPLVLAAIGVNGTAYLLADRSGTGAASTGAIVVWALLGATLSFAVPAVSYLFVWPTLFALVARRSRHVAAEWVAAFIALTMLAGFTYTGAVIMLGVSGGGAIALVALTSLLVWLLGALVARVFANWRLALAATAVMVVMTLVYAQTTVRQTAAHPAPSTLIFAQNVGDSDAFFGTTSPREPWTRSVLRTVQPGPPWTARLGASSRVLYGHSTPSMILESPTVSLAGDSTAGNVRRIGVRVTAERGSTALTVRVAGNVTRAAIDGRIVDTTRFRRRAAQWTTQYWNVPPEGALFSFDVPAGQPLSVEVAARRPGLPSSVDIPARPDSVVRSQIGDVTIVYRTARFR
jgi:hypothetical protein